jgi:hypothetical protein
MPKSEKVDGVRTGSLTSKDEDAATVALEEAVERELSPTTFVATALTVYVPDATSVNSTVVDVVVNVATSALAELIR